MGAATTVLAIALALTGCYAPGYVDCEVTCPGGESCPDGLRCVAGLCRIGGNTGQCGGPSTGDGGPGDGVMIDGSPGVDTDGDGVSDDIDNCLMMMNPNQANEDNDSLGDICDPCPVSANNVDTDGDSVGDGCEPIASGTDKLLLFEGFHDPVTPAGALVLGNWTFSGGKARNVSGVGVASSITFPVTSPSNRRETIVARVTVDAQLSSPSDPTGAGVVSRTDTVGDIGVQCGIGRDAVTGTDHLLLVRLAAAADSRMTSNASNASAGTSTIVSITRNPMNNAFACNQPGSTVAQIPSPIPNPASPRAGIRTRSMSASFDWVMIFETQ
ncbi:MAG: hypothetical protein H0T89_12635 [Deltaproteobacteria bacterium]|nr:hypothetical protein [Deltaproteobacteria bacterium]MDQ3295578.1 hypothetical protein [Myxococcota bacterium]